VPFINRTNSIQQITQIFTTAQTNDWKRMMEPLHPVHKPWVELTEANDNITWEPSPNDSYTGSQGGPKHGPTQSIINIARQSWCLAFVFLGILPLVFFQTVIRRTQSYCYEEWVVETIKRDRDGNPEKKKLLKPCSPDTPGARYHVKKGSKYSCGITTGYVLAWVAILILQGAHFGTQKRSAKKMWRQPPYEINLSYVQDSMTLMSYEFMHSYIHFADNGRRPQPAGEQGYDPLFKVTYTLDTMMSGIQGWLVP
jgi:hypothetical protein